MARKSKYSAALVKQIVGLLEDGNTDADTCALAGIGHDTFYSWLNAKPEFSEAVSHARGVARQRAVDAYRAGMQSNQETVTADETFSETRIDKDGKPYTYTRKTIKRQLVDKGPDWRAAESYLKRRDPEHWAETFVIKVNADHVALLKKFGLTPAQAFEEMIREFASANTDAD